MPYVDLASIACGGHAGDQQSMSRCVELAKAHHATIGAHPSYPDRENFGRVSMRLSPEQLSQSLFQQLAALHGLCRQKSCQLAYVKPHGALYNDMMRDLKLFSLLLQSLSEIKQQLSLKAFPLVVQAIPNRSEHLRLAAQYDIELLFEAFADRRYQSSGALVPRSENSSVLSCVEDIIGQSKQILSGELTTNTGDTLKIDAQCICIHSDNPHSVRSVKMLKNLLSTQVK